jgi:hypothetical protein
MHTMCPSMPMQCATCALGAWGLGERPASSISKHSRSSIWAGYERSSQPFPPPASAILLSPKELHDAPNVLGHELPSVLAC